MSQEDDNDWMDDASHADLKSALIDAYSESKRLRASLTLIQSCAEQLNRFSPVVRGGEGDMELHDVGDYLNRDDVTRLIAESIRQSKWVAT